jgi:hypothetical protein
LSLLLRNISFVVLDPMDNDLLKLHTQKPAGSRNVQAEPLLTVIRVCQGDVAKYRLRGILSDTKLHLFDGD